MFSLSYEAGSSLKLVCNLAVYYIISVPTVLPLTDLLMRHQLWCVAALVIKLCPLSVINEMSQVPVCHNTVQILYLKIAYPPTKQTTIVPIF